jgi:hypothetical protein
MEDIVVEKKIADSMVLDSSGRDPRDGCRVFSRGRERAEFWEKVNGHPEASIPAGELSPAKSQYFELESVLRNALSQAAEGKGKERHANGENFEDQMIMWIEETFKSFQLGQAVKKMHESQRLDVDAAIVDLLGAINYIAARIIFLKKQSGLK